MRVSRESNGRVAGFEPTDADDLRQFETAVGRVLGLYMHVTELVDTPMSCYIVSVRMMEGSAFLSATERFEELVYRAKQVAAVLWRGFEEIREVPRVPDLGVWCQVVVGAGGPRAGELLVRADMLSPELIMCAGNAPSKSGKAGRRVLDLGGDGGERKHDDQ